MFIANKVAVAKPDVFLLRTGRRQIKRDDVLLCLLIVAIKVA